MRTLSKTLSVSMIIAILLGIMLLTRTPGAAHANAVAQVSPKGTGDWQHIVTHANPYVHVVNGSATIDPQISQALSQDDVALVKQAVAKFNSLPSTLRNHSQFSGTSTIKGTQPNASQSAFQWAVNVYWWGVRLWINSPAAQSFGIFMSLTGGAIGGAIGNIVGATVGLVVGAIVGGVTGAATAFVDYACGGQGAFIDITWILIVNVAQVC